MGYDFIADTAANLIAMKANDDGTTDIVAYTGDRPHTLMTCKDEDHASEMMGEIQRLIIFGEKTMIFDGYEPFYGRYAKK